MKCERCNGTGYQSAAREMGMEDYPMMQRPIGIWRCDYCGGTGEQTDYRAIFDKWKEDNPEEYLEYRERVKEVLSILNI